jgi:hypothetical protein
MRARQIKSPFVSLIPRRSLLTHFDSAAIDEFFVAPKSRIFWRQNVEQ